MWRHVSRVGRKPVAVALTLGLVSLVVALVVTLSRSPTVVASINSTPVEGPILEGGSGTGACQDGEMLPAGISAIRLTLVASVGPRVSLTALSGAHVLTGGSIGSGWTSGNVTVPVKPLAHPVSGARICFELGRSPETVQVGGGRAGAAPAATDTNGNTLPGRFTVEYMRAGHDSWWSMAETAARHLGLGRAPGGTWVALLLLVAMGTALVIALWLVLKELG
jgi:hypothetical protein